MGKSTSKKKCIAADLDEDYHFGVNGEGVHYTASSNIADAMAGRPVQYREIYGPLLIFHMSKGYSFSTFQAIVSVVERTIYAWLKKYPEFQLCKDIGEGKKRLEWEGIIAKSAKGKSKGNAAAIIFALKNYYPDQYKDKREIETSGTIMVVDTGIKRELPNVIEVETLKSVSEEIVESVQIEHDPTNDEGDLL